MPKICTLFCLVQIKKCPYFNLLCVLILFSWTLAVESLFWGFAKSRNAFKVTSLEYKPQSIKSLWTWSCQQLYKVWWTQAKKNFHFHLSPITVTSKVGQKGTKNLNCVPSSAEPILNKTLTQVTNNQYLDCLEYNTKHAHYTNVKHMNIIRKLVPSGLLTCNWVF